MRNAVIRKKVLREQAIIRRFLLTPQRFIIGAPPADVDWRRMAQPLWGGAL
jgi:hypothetical protein